MIPYAMMTPRELAVEARKLLDSWPGATRDGRNIPVPSLLVEALAQALEGTNTAPGPVAPPVLPTPNLRVRADQVQVGDVIVQGGSRGYTILVTRPPVVREGDHGRIVAEIGALGFVVSDEEPDLLHVFRPARPPCTPSFPTRP